MPATAPATLGTAAALLGSLGQRIQARRKALRISAVAAAEAAGMSRVTLHRIERGEASVTMGAYVNAMAALGLEMAVVIPGEADAPVAAVKAPADPGPPRRIKLADYPQLRRLAWHAPGAGHLTPQEALNLYERNWRHIDAGSLTEQERRLVDTLARTLGKGKLLV